jgi:peptidoglycan L-alanyl-D-glutamate endopeptidase CwlK
MSFKFSSRSKAVLETVSTDLQLVANRAIEISKVDFGIPSTGGLRTAEEQFELYKQGASQLDGYEKKSYHQTGNALDVYAYVDGKASWQKEHLAMVACAMLQAAAELNIKLEWGGLWTSFVDMPHFQIPRG